MLHGPPQLAPLTPAIRAALAHCCEQTRQHSKTFYFGSRFFPAGQREAVWAVYAACRQGDDIADEPLNGPLSPQAELDAWWHRIQRALAGQPETEPVSAALAWAAAQFELPLSAFHELYLGLQMDLNGHEYRAAADLELYCRRVAGVVGFMIAPICGYDGGERTLQAALKLGQAMQLTNILRDVGEDLQRGRVYLPQDLLTEYHLSREDLERGEVRPTYRELMRSLSSQARAWYADGRGGLGQLHGSGRLAVATAARAYEGILSALEANDYDNFRQRAYVSGPRKLMMLPAAWWEVRASTPNA